MYSNYRHYSTVNVWFSRIIWKFSCIKWSSPKYWISAVTRRWSVEQLACLPSSGNWAQGGMPRFGCRFLSQRFFEKVSLCKNLLVRLCRIWGQNINISNDLRWSFHCSVISVKAIKVASCMLPALQHNCVSHFRAAYITHCRANLEYSTQVWSPFGIIGLERGAKVLYQSGFPTLFSWSFLTHLCWSGVFWSLSLPVIGLLMGSVILNLNICLRGQKLKIVAQTVFNWLENTVLMK